MLFVCKGSYRKKGLREITDSASAKLHLHEVPFISLILLEFPIMLTSILTFFVPIFFLNKSLMVAIQLVFSYYKYMTKNVLLSRRKQINCTGLSP